MISLRPLAAGLILLGLPVAVHAQGRPSAATLPSVSTRTLKICVADGAPAEIKSAAQAVLAACGTSPLLRTMAGSAAPSGLTDTAALLSARPEERAYSHLILVGLTTDPLIQAAWQREARLTDTGSLYAFGFGYLSGNIGYIESDRNPFLHGNAIKMAPFETEVITVTGTTPAGVALAARALIDQGLVNGLVAAPGWKRPQPNLLERDPLTPGFTLPAFLPTAADGLPRIAVTQASEDEYRGVLADTGVEPTAIWRAKYHRPNAWDGAGAASAFADYAAGLHRRAYGDTLWCAQFPSAAAAAAAAPKVAHAANLKQNGTEWRGMQPPYTQGDVPGPLTLWQRGEWLLMSTLPDAPTQDLIRATEAGK